MAKSITFLSNYGGGASQLARQLHISFDEASSFLQAKKEAYSGMERWKILVTQELRRKGYVKTMYGSRKHVYDKLFDSELSSYYERSSINYLVQSVCADYLKVVLSNLWKKKTFQRHNANFICPLYD